ncbi:MAG: galactokinase [Deltaproteobacteria bacterium CG11_big_fil_rev_8_21_14_0_20_47_16]|nr:MAG: galactokinase [Deltaproteobacteria bacterium CG11_big_fil_rev_8_21_14_0_20_47_16]
MLVTRAPLRFSLGGGGTDIPTYANQFGGFILSVAINKYVYINLNKPNISDVLRVKYSRTEEVENPDQLQHELVKGALKLTGVYDKIEISAMADVPSGTGLGSSGSFLAALLMALHTYKRQHVPPIDLAEEACRIEMDIAGKPVGKHDQYLAVFGGFTCLDIQTDGSVKVSPLKIDFHCTEELRNNLFFFYTGVRRDSSLVLADQAVGVASNQQVLEGFHQIKEIGYQVKTCLERGDLDGFGKLLNRHWEIKKQTSTQMTKTALDKVYEDGIASGALGGKLIGAGGGGFMMFYCPSDGGRQRRLRQAMNEHGLKEMLVDFDLEGTKVVINI